MTWLMLAAVTVTACIHTPEPRCWTDRAIYSVSPAPVEAPMPKGKP